MARDKHDGALPPDKDALRGFDVSVAHPARVYNYLLGGKDNFAADREAAEKMIAGGAKVLVGVRANRAFLGRAVRFLAGEAGIRQFLDIGTGLPSEDNTHEVAQTVAPQSRIVYVDNDPIVLSHAHALLKSAPAGACQYIQADLRDPRTILDEAAKTLDFGRPVAIMILMTLQYVPDADDPQQIVRTLVDAVPSGSYLAISDVAMDLAADANVVESADKLNEQLGTTRQTIRRLEQIAGFFSGLQMVDPGLVQLPQWRPDPGNTGPAQHVTLSAYCGIGRKP
ncbi:MAG: SAM-dependent methyltransferase [Trebonia sp.]